MIYIKDENKIHTLRAKMNKDNTCIFMDFDKTITTGESQDSWDASANSEKRLSNGLEEYYKKYAPIESDYTMDIKEKENHMCEWYQQCMDLYYKYHMTESKLQEAIHNSRLILRKGAKSFLKQLHQNHVPVVIFSAGIGNVIENILQQEDCNYDNIKIISNFIKFDENGDMLTFSGTLIHTLNKNIDKLKNLNEKEQIEAREYRVAIGDLIEDTYMIGECPKDKTLKIGFLNKNIQENLEVYKENFDIVLTGKSDFCDIENMIKL